MRRGCAVSSRAPAPNDCASVRSARYARRKRRVKSANRLAQAIASSLKLGRSRTNVSAIPVGCHSTGGCFSKDGQWLYFSVGATDNSWSIWRSHPDGSNAVQLTTGTPWAQRPDPSPDNSKVAFRTSDSVLGGGIRVTDMSTGQPSPWIVSGLEPRWSPTGERIAVMPDGTGPLMVVAADGSNPHAITGANTNFGWQLYDQNFDWSPDGKWLVVSYNYMIQLLQVDTGLLLPLAWSQIAGQPAWEP